MQKLCASFWYNDDSTCDLARSSYLQAKSDAVPSFEKECY